MKLLVLGAGLIGSSIGLACREAGWEVAVADQSPSHTNAATAITGLGTELSGDPDVVVVAVPPTVAAALISEAVTRFPESTVIDVASVKTNLVAEVEALIGAVDRYVPTHPMSGREISGAAGATYDLFVDRLWVFDAAATGLHAERVMALIQACGAIPMRMPIAEHDATVATTSHLPQLLATALAGMLNDLDERDLAVSGQGLRDMTRIAASNPALWTEILIANRRNLQQQIATVVQVLSEASMALESKDLAKIRALLERGNRGRSRLPGKHGNAPKPFETVAIVIDDRPGQLAAIFRCAERAQLNIEDVRIDHALGRAVAVIELDVLPENADSLRDALTADGWRLRHSVDPD